MTCTPSRDSDKAVRHEHRSDLNCICELGWIGHRAAAWHKRWCLGVQVLLECRCNQIPSTSCSETPAIRVATCQFTNKEHVLVRVIRNYKRLSFPRNKDCRYNRLRAGITTEITTFDSEGLGTTLCRLVRAPIFLEPWASSAGGAYALASSLQPGRA